jgi:hypothetical protein
MKEKMGVRIGEGGSVFENQSTNRPINQSINQSINGSVDRGHAPTSCSRPSCPCATGLEVKLPMMTKSSVAPSLHTPSYPPKSV